MLPLAQQHLDLAVLEAHPLQSTWYLHAQPPLFNLLIAIVLRWSPLSAPVTFHGLWLVLGVVLTAVTYQLLRLLGLGRTMAIIATVVITASPAVILFESWLFYDYAVAVGLTTCVLCIARWAERGTWVWLAGAVGAAAGCVLTRSLVHPAWFGAVVVLLLMARRPTFGWRPATAIIALPTLLIAGVLVKNAVLFDSPAMSSWLGWNLQRVTVDELPPDVLDARIADGTLTELARYPVQMPIESYAGATAPCRPAHPEVEALAAARKVTGRENFNHECYLPVLDEALDNSLAAARAEPRRAMRAMLGGYEIWAMPASLYAFVHDNWLHIEGVDAAYRRTVLLDVGWDPPIESRNLWILELGSPGGRARLSLTVVASTIAAVVLGALGGWRVVRSRATPRDVLLAAIGGTVLFVTVVGNAFELGENHRFRFLVEPMTMAVWAWCVAAAATAVVRRVRAAGAGASAPGTAS